MRRFVWLLAVLALAAAACGTTKDTGFSPTPTPTESEDHGDGGGDDTSTLEEPAPYEAPIDVADNKYVPRFVEVEAGTEVLWVQTGVAPHNVAADDGSFNSHPDCATDISSCMGAGDEYTLTFDEPGEYPYFCEIHGVAGAPENESNMAGVIIVT